MERRLLLWAQNVVLDVLTGVNQCVPRGGAEEEGGEHHDDEDGKYCAC